MDELQEYIVTLHNRQDLEQFYQDMETPGGGLYIPNRAVDVVNRRPTSRNTHYWLSDQEAQTLRLDPRVRAVELTVQARGIKIIPTWTQTGDFTKTLSATTDDKNWALLRCTEGVVTPTWGADNVPVRSETVSWPIEGYGVDVVIVDGIIKEFHAEFLDQFGASRITQFNWFSLNPEVTGAPVDDYAYLDSSPGDADHGTHVAGTVVGNTQGWARRANVYNISPYGLNFVTIDLIFDYIRAWHNAKTADPVTNVPLPTICNNSWGAAAFVTIANMNAEGATVVHRGITYTGPWDEFGNGIKTWQELGFDDNMPFLFDGDYYLQCRAEIVSLITDLEDAIDDGIHIVWAAGNDSRRQDVDGGLDVDNRIELGPFTFYINRHTCLGSKVSAQIQAVVDVGAIGANNLEPLATFTNRGPSVDIFAPGEGIVSAVNSVSPDGDADDPRGQNDDRIASLSGTSMAAPQVAGVMACFLELNPAMTPAELKSWIIDYGSSDLISTALATTNDYDDEYSLQGAPNLSLFAVTPTFSFAFDTTSILPGETVTATITTENVPDGSLLYVLADAAASNFDGEITAAVIPVNSDTATCSFTASESRTGESSFTLTILTGGFDGPVQAVSDPITLAANFEFDTVPTEIEEGNTGTFTVTTIGVADDTVLYWTINHVTTTNLDFEAVSGSFEVQNDSGSFQISINTDLTLEDTEAFTVSIRTGSVSGQIRATSDVILLINGIQTFNNSVTLAGSGLWQSNTVPAISLRASKSFTTNVDIRLPQVAFLTSNLTAFGNAEIKVTNIALFPSPATITANSRAFANTIASNIATLTLALSSTQGLRNGFKLVTANIPSAANSTIQRIFSNNQIVVENLPINANVIVDANEPCYFYPKSLSYRNLKTFTSNTALANVLVLSLESVENIAIGSLASTANILSLVRDDTLTTVRKIFRANNTVVIQNIDANVTVAAGEYLTFNTRPTVGAVRIKQEVIHYERLWTSNSTLSNLTRNVGNTPFSSISGNVPAGHIVSILGLQTVNS